MTVTRWRLRRAQAVVLAVLTVMSATAVVLVSATPAQATHFRFRTITWEQIGPQEVRFDMTVADRMSYHGSLAVGQPWNESMQDFGDGSGGSMTGQVTAVNTVDDWFLAEVSTTHVYAGSGPWTAAWSGCCTLSTLKNSPDSSLLTRAVVDLRTTASPRTSVSPIVNVLVDDGTGDGIRRIKVPAMDADSSALTYRLATEVESSVTQPPGLTVDSRTGVLSWPVRPLSGQPGLYMATVVVADAQGAEVQVTFLLNLGNSGSGLPPRWVSPPTPPDRSELSPRTTPTITLEATDPEGTPVTLTNLGLPAGVSCAPASPAPPVGTARSVCQITAADTDFDFITFDAQDSDGSSAGPRNYLIGGGRYVAMGDGFAAGSGASASAQPGTAQPGVNQCRRAAAAYSFVVGAAPTAPQTTENVACLDARIADLTQTAASTSGPPWDEGSQVGRLGQDVTLVTLQVGAADLGLADLLRACVQAPCLRRQDATARNRIAALGARGAAGRSPLEELLHTVQAAAPKAELVLVGYPRLFARSGNLLSCAQILPGDQRWLNGMVSLLNDTSETVARRVGVRFADVEDVFDGRTACEASPLVDRIVTNAPWRDFQPTAAGQSALGAAILAELARPRGADVVTVIPGATSTVTTVVPAGAAQAAFRNGWPGSDIVLTLVSPSGRVIVGPGDRTPGTRQLASDVEHVLGPTSELFLVTDPEPGSWTVHRFGLDVGADGEPSELIVNALPAANQAPVAVVTQSVSGPSVTLSAAGSTDADGSVRSYLWDLGDGTTSTARALTHTYRVPGAFTPTLVVTDDRGAEGFATGNPVVVTTVAVPPAPPGTGQRPINTGGAAGPGGGGQASAAPSPPAAAPSPSPTVTPASSVAPTQPGTVDPPASPLAAPTLTAPRLIEAGAPATVAIAATPGSTVELWGYTRPSTTYRRLRHSIVVPASGVAFATVRPLTSTRLAARHPRGPAGGSAAVLVSPRVSASARSLGARTYLLSGQVWPARAGVLVGVLARTPAGREVAVAADTTDARGRWSVTRTFGSGRLTSLQARTRGDLVNAAGHSAVLRFALG